jgi:hypothetical protein
MNIEPPLWRARFPNSTGASKFGLSAIFSAEQKLPLDLQRLLWSIGGRRKKPNEPGLRS